MSALQVRGEESDLENTVVLEKGPKHVGPLASRGRIRKKI